MTTDYGIDRGATLSTVNLCLCFPWRTVTNDSTIRTPRSHRTVAASRERRRRVTRQTPLCWHRKAIRRVSAGARRGRLVAPMVPTKPCEMLLGQGRSANLKTKIYARRGTHLARQMWRNLQSWPSDVVPVIHQMHK